MAAWINICEVFWPVGSIYMSYSSTSPANLFGGQWMQISGRFLYPSTSAGSTGGSNTHNHPLSSNGGALVDLLLGDGKWWNIATSSSARYNFPSGFNKRALEGITSNPSTDADSLFHAVDLIGTTDNRETLPSYITVYCWRRTA